MKRPTLNKLLLAYANTLEIEYLGERCAKIKFMGRCKLPQLEDKLREGGDFTAKFWSYHDPQRPYHFKWIEDFSCNGIWTTATIRLQSWSLPFEKHDYNIIKTTDDGK